MSKKENLPTKAIIKQWEKEFRKKYPEGTPVPQKAIILELSSLIGQVVENLDLRLNEVEEKIR
ncbi:hypothetical protein GF359_05100 [candidate division WOR-3 bacterium]|uniref:Uncharacterized protein n=1 Tax=candidate division WOR-3 bacterium TaxID=2052148 RepID=A0A9D5QCD8_UNCW3|nr:hypothetical protein [candidate division WOR-3 bacterium]MBD3364573.1 hypothetical protein [candidate division WOR-3 bacterium]